MPRTLPLLLLASIIHITQITQAAPSYIQVKPLAQSLAGVNTGNVATGTPIQVPMITRGGDIATILANGNTERTAKGSLFAKAGLDLKLVREDNFAKQVETYIRGKSPYLRGTLGMINMAVEALSRDPATRPVIIYQMTWSAGSDALVVGPKTLGVKQLKDTTIALQAFGPHVDYMTKILADGGLTPMDVKLRWLPDLTGTENTPMAALQQGDVNAAFVITPDAMVLTSDGTIGTGAEESVRGARILLSTRTANRIISDVYAVRSDYLQRNRDQVQRFVHGLLQGAEVLGVLFHNKGSHGRDYKETLTAAARLLFDNPKAVTDVEGLYAECEYVGWQGNSDFFTNAAYPRSLQYLTDEIQPAFLQLGLIGGQLPLAKVNWDYNHLRSGLATTNRPTQRFDQEQVAAVVARKQRQGSLGEGELFSFEIFFKPNQNSFAADPYQQAFATVIDYAATYGGALITVEGHSDPLGYLRKKKAGEPQMLLGRIKQSAKNLSLSRSVAVRNSIISFARGRGITLDSSQFAIIGHGIAKPRSGICGSDPCPPKTEGAWRNNMRVEFRILQVESEASIFTPL